MTVGLCDATFAETRMAPGGQWISGRLSLPIVGGNDDTLSQAAIASSLHRIAVDSMPSAFHENHPVLPGDLQRIKCCQI